MLEEPRWLLARAPLPLPEEPENALRLLALGELETCLLPARSPPPRFIVPALRPLERFPPPGLEPPRPPALGLLERFPPPGLEPPRPAVPRSALCPLPARA